MPMTLREITADNWREASRLKLADNQRNFLAHNAYSILEASYEPDHLFCRAVYDGDTMVGFLMYGFDPEKPRDWWIIRLMVALEHQGKGYGRATMEAAIDLLKQKPDCDAIYIGFVAENTVARRLYESLGFVDTGEMHHGEHIFRLPLDTEKSDTATQRRSDAE
jgi:diamine N-acetyltransferase